MKRAFFVILAAVLLCGGLWVGPVQAGVDISTTAATCPNPTVQGLPNTNPGLWCYTQGSSPPALWMWTGTNWTQTYMLPAGQGVTASPNIVAGCLSAVLQGVSQGANAAPTCSPGDLVMSVQLPGVGPGGGFTLNAAMPPGPGFVAYYTRQSLVFGQSFCTLVAVGGRALSETIIKDQIPC